MLCVCRHVHKKGDGKWILRVPFLYEYTYVYVCLRELRERMDRYDSYFRGISLCKGEIECMCV